MCVSTRKKAEESRHTIVFVLPEPFGARFNAPINVPNALRTEIISAVRGLKGRRSPVQMDDETNDIRGEKKTRKSSHQSFKRLRFSFQPSVLLSNDQPNQCRRTRACISSPIQFEVEIIRCSVSPCDRKASEREREKDQRRKLTKKEK